MDLNPGCGVSRLGQDVGRDSGLMPGRVTVIDLGFGFGHGLSLGIGAGEKNTENN